MSLKSRMMNGYRCVVPGIGAPIRDKDGKVAKLHVLGPNRTRKTVLRIQAERAASRAATEQKPKP